MAAAAHIGYSGSHFGTTAPTVHIVLVHFLTQDFSSVCSIHSAFLMTAARLEPVLISINIQLRGKLLVQHIHITGPFYAP